MGTPSNNVPISQASSKIMPPVLDTVNELEADEEEK
jgi:hypothetical protein